MRRGVILCRSAGNDIKQIEKQKAACSLRASEEGTQILKIIISTEDTTRLLLRNNAELQEIIEMAEHGEFDVLYTMNEHRISRNKKVVAEFLGAMEANGISVCMEMAVGDSAERQTKPRKRKLRRSAV